MKIIKRPTDKHDLGYLFFSNNYTGELEKFLVKEYFNLHQDMEYTWPDKDVVIEGKKGTQLGFRVPDEFDVDEFAETVKDYSIAKDLNEIIENRDNQKHNQR